MNDNAATFSNDGSQLGIGYANSAIRLWDFTEKKPKETGCQHDSILQSLAFDPHNNKKITAGGFRLLQLFDLEKQICIQKFNAMGAVERNSAIVYGENIIINSIGAQINLWDERQPEKIVELKGHTLPINALVINNNTGLLSCSNDHSIIKWDLRTLSCQKKIHQHDRWIKALCYSPDYQQFASGDCDGTVYIWDANTCEHLKTIDLKDKYVSVVGLAYLRENHLITHHDSYSCSDKDNITIFKKNKCVHTIHLAKERSRPFYAHTVAFSPDAQKIAVVDPRSLRIVEFADLNKYRDCTLVNAMQVLDAECETSH